MMLQIRICDWNPPSNNKYELYCKPLTWTQNFHISKSFPNLMKHFTYLTANLFFILRCCYSKALDGIYLHAAQFLVNACQIISIKAWRTYHLRHNHAIVGFFRAPFWYIGPGRPIPIGNANYPRHYRGVDKMALLALLSTVMISHVNGWKIFLSCCQQSAVFTGNESGLEFIKCDVPQRSMRGLFILANTIIT